MMECNVINRNKYFLIQAKGEVDMSTSPALRKAVLESLKKQKGILVDLSQVVYIDSSGLASLIEGYQYARTNSLPFGLVQVPEVVSNVLELARLDRIFHIYKDTESWEHKLK
ncbi:MAG TPA: STAS domain-containing protein [Thermodesulfovibrionia bacterium]|nr:STAS domain-containing protein [Thermodesulfovibrionia bacterium]